MRDEEPPQCDLWGLGRASLCSYNYNHSEMVIVATIILNMAPDSCAVTSLPQGGSPAHTASYLPSRCDKDFKGTALLCRLPHSQGVRPRIIPVYS